MENEIYLNLKKSATETFLKQGYNSCTMAEIEKNAGVRPGTGHLFFESKSQLFSIVTESIADNILAECADIISDKTLDISERLDSMLEFLRENSLKLESLFSEHKRNSRNIKEHNLAGIAVYESFAESLGEYLKEGCDKGIFNIDNPKARAYNISFGLLGLRNSGISETEKYNDLKYCILKMTA